MEFPRGSSSSRRAQDSRSARGFLRQATHEAHKRLEGMLRLASPMLSRDEYKEIIQRFFFAYTVLEGRIEPRAQALAQAGLDWNSRRKLPLLARDLEALGVLRPGPATALAKVPLPHLDTHAEAFGCLYVLEGATLGGKLISKNLQALFEMGASNGAAFFNSYGSEVQENWEVFCTALEVGLPDEPARKKAAVAASATFELFAACVAAHGA